MDYFNSEEREKQKTFAAWRDKALQPVVRTLVALGVSQNAVTVAGVLCLLAASLIPPNHTGLLAGLLVAYVVLDGIDGPVARYRNNAHNGGALVDMFADQLGIVVLPAAAAYHFGMHGEVVVLFSTGYLLFVVFAVLTNEMQIAIPTYLRLKYPFYVLYVWAASGMQIVLELFMIFTACYYWIMTIIALRAVYNHYDATN